MKNWKQALFWAAVLVALLVAAVRYYPSWQDQSVTRTAMDKFPGLPEQALIALVQCETCDMHDRDLAVGALGRMGSKSSLPVLRKYVTGHKCDHGKSICQFDLKNSIDRIEGHYEFGFMLNVNHLIGR